ncbi:P-type conjugative transfer protein TrbJ [Vibrio parahaemolyticus]|nr:P-type conjugative transfer protein TrbJ [Vibrio parahaemolyticus]
MSIYYPHKPLNLLVLCVCFSLTPQSTVAGGNPLAGATEPTQILNNIELIDVAIKEGQVLAYNISQYQTMLQNLQALPTYYQQLALADLTALASIVSTTRGLAYSSLNMDVEYRDRFKDALYYSSGANRDANNKMIHADYQARYEDWSDINHDSIRSALNAAGLQAQQFSREDNSLKAIETQIQTGIGQKQLLQAGASISAMQVEQMQKLRALMMADMQMKGSYQGGQVDRQAESDADALRALTPNPTTLDDSRSGGITW